ncbi:MAG: carboxypeptidase regulatory-like domain-containing protein [Pseudomonadota bacterium]|nr:carboxypeptidase regulatory-like domain-containing protein [Pseudomonadota bacterium]
MIGLGGASVHAVDEGGAPVQGATVTLTSSSVFGGVQTAVTDAAGTALFARVFNGDVTASAVRGSGSEVLSGSAVGTIINGNTPLIEITMTNTGTGTLTGTVTKGLASEPQSGVEVRLQATSGTRTVITGADGRYQFAQVEVGQNLRVTALVNQRVRSRADVRLNTPGETLVRDLVMLGAGTVTGNVTNAQGQAQSGVTVTLTNSDSTYGGTWSVTTQGNGTYTLADIPAGAFTIRARNNDGRLQAQDSGLVRFDGDTVTVNLTLVDSAVTMPVTLYDANGANFDIQGNGAIATGVNSVFRGDNAANQQANRLDILVNSVVVPFQNGDGSVGRRTQSGQLLEVDEFNQASGLDITRRVYVPKNGYFTRYLEILENRTENPITVGIRVSSNYETGYGGARVVDSSNSDNVLTSSDRWVVIDDDRDEDAFDASDGNPAVAHVFDGADGETHAVSASTAVVGTATRAQWQWESIIIPAGSSVGFLHFTSQQVGRIAARATAERLVQLPPEALEGLTADERAIIRNFRVPADGLSSLQPLPVVEGNSVSGVVYSGDGTTPIASASVTFRNVLPYYGRTYRVTANAAGAWTLQSVQFGNSNVKAIARDAFSVFARHPKTDALTPSTIGIFVADQPTATQDLIFTGTGNLRGTVRRHNGAVVQNGTATIPYRFPDGGLRSLSATIDTAGAFQFTGINPNDYLVSAEQPHPQGQPITGSSDLAVSVSPSNTTLATVTMQPTGEITGTVREADGDPAVGANVCIPGVNVSCYRQTTTDTGGRYRFTDVATGARVVRASDAGLEAQGNVTVATDTVGVVDLQLSGLGTLDVQVNFARGVPATNVQVRLNSTSQYRNTDGAGRTSYTVPAAVAQSVTTWHPDNSELSATGSATVASHGGNALLTLTLPAAGSILGTVVRPDGSTLAAGVSMTLRRQDGSGWQRSSTTTSTGTYRFNGLIPASYTISAADAATVRFADADATVVNDGQEVTVNLRLADNRIPLPAELRDANNFQYDIQRPGHIAGGSQTYYNVFTGNGGSQLEINGAAYSGDTSALLEAGRRQFAITQPAPIAGLTVTRKVFVPFGAYFARYMEVLSNPGTAPVTVSVRIRNNYAATNTIFFTSSGDTALQTADTWGVFDDSQDLDPFTTSSYGPATALVLGTAGASVPHTSFTRPANNRVEAEWAAVTVPAGGKRILMHFDVQQVNRAGARAAAERLQQLPPEALQSLTADELANIVNFNVPTDGVSTVAPLPSLLGRVSGVVYEGDGVTIVPQAAMELRGTHPLFSRTYIPDVYSGCEMMSGAFSLTATATGAYNLNGVLQAVGSIALPVGYEVVVRSASRCRFQTGHPQSYAPSPDHPVTIDAATGTATRDVLFASGILTGRVIGPSDYSVSGAQVQVSLPNVNTTVNTNAQAQYRFNGVPAGTYTLNATLSHNQGTDLRGSVSAMAVVGQTTVTDIEIEPAGSVTGAVVTANGEAAASSSVQLRSVGGSRTITRSSTTDSLGRFNFTAVPIGTYTLSVTDPRTSAVTSANVTVTRNNITTQNLVMIGTGAVQLTVSYARGITAADSNVSLLSNAVGTSYVNVGRTDALGRLNVLVPVGNFTLRTRHPSLNSLYSEVSGTITANNQTLTLSSTLPPLANVRLTVTDRDAANVPIQSASVYMSYPGCTNCYIGTTDASGRILASNIRQGSYTFRAVAPDGRAALTGGTIDTAADGQTIEKSVSVSVADYSYGTFTFGSQRQLYSVQANAGDVISIGVNGYPVGSTPASYLAKAQVYSPTGAQLARGYGYNSAYNYEQYNEYNDLQNIVAPVTGAYTVVTSPYYEEYLGGYRVQASVNGTSGQLQSYVGGGSVTGLVTRADGSTPAADRIVQLQTGWPLEMRVRTLTAADGTYSFGGVPVGSFHVAVLDDAGTQLLAEVNDAVSAAGQVVTGNLRIPPRTTLQVSVTISSALAVPSQLYFTVTDNTGSRQRGPVTFTSGQNTSSTVEVDAYGDSVSVRAVHPNSSQVSNTVTVTGVDGGTVPVNVLLAASSLSGTVLRANGEPADDYFLELSYTNGNYIGGTYTDSNGHYEYYVVPSGQELTLAVRDDASGVWQIERITPRPDQAEQLDVQLRGEGGVSGRVTLANGTPAANMEVRAQFESDSRYGNSAWRYAYTDANGDYQFSGLPVQVPITVQARIHGDFGDLIASETVTVPTDGANVTANLVFAGADSSVTIRVIAADDSPLPGNCEFRLNLSTPGGEGEQTNGTTHASCSEGGVFYNVPSGAATASVFETNSYAEYGPVPVTVLDNVHVNVEIPTSIVKGTVRHSDGSPVQNFNIYPDSDEGGYYQREAWSDGRYAVYGIPAGNFGIEVEDQDSGLIAFREGTMLDVTAPVELDITLPPSATVIGTFRNANGDPVAAAEVYVRSSSLELDRYAVTDDEGNYRVERVALGDITVLAHDPDTNLVSTATGVLATANSELRIDLAPPATAQLQGTLVQSDGITTVADAQVTASTLESYGPFETLTFSTVSDAAGRFSFSQLPLGGLSLVADRDGFVGQRNVVLGASGLDIQLQFGTAVHLPRSLQGADTSDYDFACNGQLDDGGYGSAGDAYDGAYALSVEQMPFPCLSVAEVRQQQRELVIGPSVIQNLEVSRRVYVPQAGGYARYLEVFNNPTSNPITVVVNVDSNLGSDSNTQQIVTPASTGNRYAVTRDSGSDPALGHVFASASPTVSGTFTLSGDILRYQWTLVVPAGQQVSLLHFAIQRSPGDSTSAAAQAQALADGSQAGMFDGLSSADRASIRNFVVAP